MEMASGEGRKAGNRGGNEEKSQQKESMRQEETSGSQFWGLKVVRGPAAVGRAEGEGQGPGEALSVAPGAPGRFPSSALPQLPTTSFRRKRCSLIRIIYKIMVHCLH